VTNVAIDVQLTQTSLWQWQTWQGLPYLTCNLLQDWSHGFFTRHYYPQTPEAFTAALATNVPVYRVKQVHGDRLLNPQEIANPETAEADGIITDSSGQAIWVASADCTPVLIGDRSTGRTVAIHSGWRGTAQGIVPKAVKRLLNTGTDIDNLVLALGPAIDGEVYQVDAEVATEVGLSLFPQETNPDQILADLFALAPSPLFADEEKGKVRLDVRQVIYHQLQQLGISDGQIAIAPFCTYQQAEHFFSYRREKAKKIQWSGIVSR
jgi:YfiH family protein